MMWLQRVELEFNSARLLGLARPVLSSSTELVGSQPPKFNFTSVKFVSLARPLPSSSTELIWLQRVNSGPPW